MCGIAKNIPKNAVWTGKRIHLRLPTFQGTSLTPVLSASRSTSVVDPNARPQSYSKRCNCQYQSHDAASTIQNTTSRGPVTCQAESDTCCHSAAAIRMYTTLLSDSTERHGKGLMPKRSCTRPFTRAVARIEC